MSLSIGMWIWQVSKCEDGSIDAIVARCLNVGLGHVLIKSNDGRGDFNGTLGPLVRALQDAGVHVWSWAYTYGRYPEQEAEVFAQRSQALGVNAMAVDAEVEYKDHPEAAERYMGALRAAVGEGMPVALSSYYRPRFHQDFPWAEFLERCDFTMPQVYWYRNDPAMALRRSVEEFAPYRRPVIATGATYPEATGAPVKILTFLQECEAHPIGQVNFWSWQHATSEMWDLIAAYLRGREPVDV